jgi:thioredoxin 1
MEIMKLLKFEASWCGPCRAMDHILDLMDLNMEVEKINIDTDSDMCKQYDVRAVPTLIKINEEGKELGRLKGLQNNDDIMKLLES